MLETFNNEKKELITKEDVFNLILCEQNEFCLSLLLKICLGLDQSAFKLEDAAYVLSLVQVDFFIFYCLYILNHYFQDM